MMMMIIIILNNLSIPGSLDREASWPSWKQHTFFFFIITQKKYSSDCINLQKL